MAILDEKTNQVKQTFPETDCVKISKIYDWIKLKTKQNYNFKIPDSDILAIEEAVEAGHVLKISADIPEDETSVVVIAIEKENPTDLCGCIGLQKTLFVYITVFDVTANIILSSFVKNIQVFDSAKACVPPGITAKNIEAYVAKAQGFPLSTVPIDGFLVIEISTCQDIQVVLEIKAQVKIEGYCTSREGISCLGTVDCAFGATEYPPQCSTPCK